MFSVIELPNRGGQEGKGETRRINTNIWVALIINTPGIYNSLSHSVSKSPEKIFVTLKKPQFRKVIGPCQGLPAGKQFDFRSS